MTKQGRVVRTAWLRRKRQSRRRQVRVAGFVRRGTPLEELQDLASHFSTPPGESGIVHMRGFGGPRAEAPLDVQQQRADEYNQACDAVEEILSECAGLPPFTEIPFSAIQKFEALAQGVTFTFRVWSWSHPGGIDAFERVYDEIHRDNYVSLVPLVGPKLKEHHDTNIGMTTPAEGGALVKAVVDYFLNPERDRLRKCAVCHRWFVDLTRNKSQLRCSPPCTAAWWTRRRRKESGHAEYRRRRARQLQRRPKGK